MQRRSRRSVCHITCPHALGPSLGQDIDGNHSLRRSGQGRHPGDETALELLGVEFHPGSAPGGSVVLMFNHGGALRLDVECLECELADLGTDDLGASDLSPDAEPSGLDA